MGDSGVSREGRGGLVKHGEQTNSSTGNVHRKMPRYLCDPRVRCFTVLHTWTCAHTTKYGGYIMEDFPCAVSCGVSPKKASELCGRRPVSVVGKRQGNLG
jgi:hypothetical protein